MRFRLKIKNMKRGKNHVKKEIESFYNIIYSNNENDKKFQKNDVYKILNVLDIIKKKHFIII